MSTVNEDGWTTLVVRHPETIVSREVRMSPSGIIVIEDELTDGMYRHTRVYPNGMHAQVTESTPRKAWLAARKAAA
jgi:hypothetical protein